MALFRYKCEELLRIIPDLQCRKCKNVPGPSDDQKHRYFCINFNESHALCYNHSAICPCGSVGQKPSPVIAKLLQGLPWMCQNYKNGCREMKADVEELEHHQEKCIFRKVYCPIVCSLVLLKDVIDHVTTCHKDIVDCKITEEGSKKLKFKAGLRNLLLKGAGKFTSDDKNVFYHAFAIRNGICYFWILLVGSPSEAKNFSCAYSIKTEIGETFTYTGPIHTLDKNEDDIIVSGSCFTMQSRVLNRSLDGEICITIRNLKEEAKDDNEESGISDSE